MPRETLAQQIPTEDALAIIDAFAATGDYPRMKFSSRWGEPGLHPDLEALIERAHSHGFVDISLSNNGSTLEGRCNALKTAGLNRMCVSLDTLDRKKYEQITGVDLLDKVLRGIEEAATVFPHEVKLNVVIIKNTNEDEIESIIEWAHARGVTPQFIEIVGIPREELLAESFVDLDPIVERLASKATLFCDDRLSKRTTIILPSGDIEVRRSRQWPNMYFDWEKVIVHPDGQFGTYMNFRPGIKPTSFTPDALVTAIRELQAVGPSEWEVQNVGRLGNRTKVS